MRKYIYKLSSIILILVIGLSGCGENEELKTANITITDNIIEIEKLKENLSKIQADLKKEREVKEELQTEFDNYKEKMSPYEELAETEIEAAKAKAEEEAAKAKAEEEAAKAKAEEEAIKAKAAEEAAKVKAAEEAEKAKVEAEKERVKEEEKRKEIEKARQAEEAENGTIGERNALSKAKQYLNYSAFSAKGLKEQLEFEGFSSSEADFGVKYCGANWNEQAALKSEQYLSYSSFSKQGLIDQLIFEGFTRDQANYGVSEVGF